MAGSAAKPLTCPPTTDLRPPLRDRVDYVAGFQDLTRLGLKMHRNGPTVPLLLQRAVLELRVGGYEAACRAAEDALVCSGRSAEAHWLHALGQLGLCLVDLGLLAGGAAPRRRRSGEQVVRQLGGVRSALAECVRLNGAQDEEAAALLAYVEAVLAAHPDRARLARLLRPLA